MQFDPEKITFFARTDARGKNVAFGIKARDRQRHVYVIGKTGMGKSTLLENMAVQDIQNGEGMAFIDPHGSAAEVLLNYIPEHRIKDVLYFAPADASHPISFNIMEDVGPDKRHLVVSGLMSVFKKIWVDAWSARMEYILQNTILALLEYPGSTLVGVNRMLSDKDYRKLVVDNVKDPSVRSFWVDEFAKYNERYMQEAGDAIKNKIGQFTANPIIRNIIGQPKSSFDIRQMMDEQKIIIMNLSKGLIGESNANLLGSMLTTRIYLAAMSRADLSPEKMKKMPNFYFYVDEFQSFANATFANILSEARKYHLNLTIAHQYIEQMEEDVRNAVFGNVGTIISFRVGPFDAEVLETIFTPQFLATDIVNLGFAQVYLTLMIDGIGSPPFSANTLPPIAPQVISYKDVVVGASRTTYARPRADVEADIVKFHEPVVLPRVERAPRSERVEEGMRTPPRPYSNGNGNGGSSREGRERTERPRERTEQSTRPRDSTSHAPTSAPADAMSPHRASPPSPANHEHRPRSGEESREHQVPQGNHMVRKDQPKKNPEIHLTELRSLLRKVVDDEKGREEPRQNDGGKQVQQEKREVSPQTQSQTAAPREVRSDSVPHNSVPGAQSHQTSALLSRENRESVPVASVERDEKERAKQALREKVSLLTANPTPPSVPPAQSSQPHSQAGPQMNISPKELERMMKVTGRDVLP